MNKCQKRFIYLHRVQHKVMNRLNQQVSSPPEFLRNLALEAIQQDVLVLISGYRILFGPFPFYNFWWKDEFSGLKVTTRNDRRTVLLE